MIDVQHSKGDLANRRAPFEDGAIPAEVPFPTILSRMIEAENAPGSRVKSGDIGALVAVAIEARERQIGRLARATVLLGDDVVDLERDRRKFWGSWQYSHVRFARSHTSETRAGSVTAHAAELLPWSDRRALERIRSSKCPTRR